MLVIIDLFFPGVRWCNRDFGVLFPLSNCQLLGLHWIEIKDEGRIYASFFFSDG